MSEKKPTSPVVFGWVIFMGLLQLIFVTAKLWGRYEYCWWATFWPAEVVIGFALLCIIILAATEKKPPQ